MFCAIFCYPIDIIGPASINNSGIDDVGIDIDIDVHVYTFNSYFHRTTNDISPIKPGDPGQVSINAPIGAPG